MTLKGRCFHGFHCFWHTVLLPSRTIQANDHHDNKWFTVPIDRRKGAKVTVLHDDIERIPPAAHQRIASAVCLLVNLLKLTVHKYSRQKKAGQTGLSVLSGFLVLYYNSQNAWHQIITVQMRWKEMS